MISFDLTISNYRCFAAEAPVRLEMRPGMTSLIGPNNSGKSTILRLFYELRSLFVEFNNNQTLVNLGRGQPRAINPTGIGDPLEIFHNRNRLPVRLEIRLTGPLGQQELSGIDLSVAREPPSVHWTATMRMGPGYHPFKAEPRFPNLTQPNRSAAPIDMSKMLRLGDEIAKSIYLPATRIAIGESQGPAYDLQIGTNFIAQWDQWKTGNTRAHNDVIVRISEDIANIFGFGRLEITATPDRRDFHVSIDGRSFKLRELGAGLAQFIIVLANVGTRNPTWLFIDEPEISLHPSLQLDFLTTLTSYASCGTLFATHSLGLARSADRALTVIKRETRAEVKPFETAGSLSEFLGEMSFAAYRDLGFDAVLLVEGVNDIKTAQQLLRLLGKDHRVVVMQLGGSTMIRKQRLDELSEMLRLTRNVHVLIDSERTTPGNALAANRQEFLNGCGQLQIAAAATDRRALEHYMSDRAVKLAFGDTYRALNQFEERSAVNPVWSKNESWRAAREMTKDELLSTDVGRFLDAV